MAWSIEFDPARASRRARHPRSIGERLHGPLRQYWKYRVGDCRLICSLKDDRLVVIVVRIGHRREIYKR